MKLFTLFALFAAASAFTVPAVQPVRSPSVSLARATAPVAVVSDKYDEKTAWIRVPGDKYVDLKELTPLYALIGTLFFIHDYLHFQLGYFPGENFFLG